MNVILILVFDVALRHSVTVSIHIFNPENGKKKPDAKVYLKDLICEA